MKLTQSNRYLPREVEGCNLRTKSVTHIASSNHGPIYIRPGLKDRWVAMRVFVPFARGNIRVIAHRWDIVYTSPAESNIACGALNPNTENRVHGTLA
jgi:hypothetical protein